MWRQINGLVLLTVLLVGCAKAHEPKPYAGSRLTEKERLQLQLARLHFDNGDYELARKEYIRLVLNYPTSYLRELAQFMIGESFFAEQDYPQAERYFNQYVVSYPSGFKRAESEVRITECLAVLRAYEKQWQMPILMVEPKDAEPEPLKPTIDHISHHVKLTWYWVAEESKYPSNRRLPVFDRAGEQIAQVSDRFFERLKMEGSGKLIDGRMINFVLPGKYMIAPETAPYGLGARSLPLIPYRSVAVDRQVLSLGTNLYMSKLDGMLLPSGKRHDGCLVASDVGSLIKGWHIDLFAPTHENALQLMRKVPEHAKVTLDKVKCQRHFQIDELI